MINDKSNHKILEELDRVVAGHTLAKKQLINLISRSRLRHYQKYMQLRHEDYCLSPNKLLLIGGSGTGKTFLVQSLQKIVDFPLIYIDATKLNPTGASGGVNSGSLATMIRNKAEQLVKEAREYYPSVEGTIDRMVVFVDEIDKLALPFESSGNWNKHVQSNFLTIFDDKGEFAGVSFIFAGAFSDLTNRKIEIKTSIGFNHAPKEEEKAKIIDDEALIKFGLIPELIGRINAIVQLDEFSVEDYYKILTEKLIPKKQYDMENFHIYELGITEDELRALCVTAQKSGQGIRSLKRELDKLFVDREFDHEDNFMLEELAADDEEDYFQNGLYTD